MKRRQNSSPQKCYLCCLHTVGCKQNKQTNKIMHFNSNNVLSTIQATIFLLTHRHTQPFYGSLDFVRDNSGEPVPEETFTHSYLSQSSIIPHLLPPSIMIHGILSVQFTCLTVFYHNLSPSFLWSTSWCDTLHFLLHTFLHPIIDFFLQHMPIPSQPVLL